jgi:hypothetical protein
VGYTADYTVDETAFCFSVHVRQIFLFKILAEKNARQRLFFVS